MKFTGHERDLASPTGAGDDLDYMHAQHESPVTGRFLSVDVRRGKARSPQSWNRYAYTYDNPLKLIDPNGQEPLPANLQGILAKNPDIASSLASGQELTEEQGQRMADAFDAASAEGVFKTGYRFVQGFLGHGSAKLLSPNQKKPQRILAIGGHAVQ